METVLSICLTALCFAIYLPVLLNAIRQVSDGEVVVRRASMSDPYPRRYRGAAATVYSLMQALAAAIALAGASIGLSRGSIDPFFIGLAASLVVGYGGVFLANQLGYERISPDEQIATMFQSILSSMGGNVWVGRTPPPPPRDDTDDEPEVIVYGPDNRVTGEDRPRKSKNLPPSDGDIVDADFEDVDDDPR